MLTDEDLIIIESLIKINKRISKLYELIVKNNDTSTYCLIISRLIDCEEVLIKKLKLDDLRLESVEEYIQEKSGVYLDSNLPVSTITYLDHTNYPFFRLLSRCRYYNSTIKKPSLDIDFFRPKIQDVECALHYLIIKNKINNLKRKKIKNKTFLHSLYVLIDSPLVEKYCMDSYLSLGTIPSSLDLYIDAYAYKNPDTDNFLERRTKIYETTIKNRCNETILNLLNLIKDEISLIGDTYKTNEVFLNLISYLKALIAISLKEDRTEIYSMINSIIEKEFKYDEYYLKILLKQIIVEVEEYLVPKRESTSIIYKMRR